MRNQLLMTKIYTLILILSAGFATLNAQNLPREIVVRNGQQFYVYHVQQGEGLQAISRTFSVSVAEILQHNPNANVGLQLGQRLYIPVQQPVASSQNATYHVILPQETLFSVAQAFSLRPDDLIAANPGLSAETFHIGRIIRIPLAQTTATVVPQQPVASNPNATYHVILPQETLFSVSQAFSLRPDDLIAANPGLSAETFHIGRIIRIPVPQTAATVVPQQPVASNPNVTYHVILPQETLFSVSQAFSLRPDDLIAANPGLSAETFHIGRIIRIPVAQTAASVQPGHTRHVVQAGETLFSISRRYNIDIDDIVQANPTVAQGLRVNMELQIPIGNPASTQVFSPNPQSAANTIRVALLLPFNDETNDGHHRMREYYEGFMMAVLRLRDAGANMEVFPFDIGRGNDTRRLESMLETLEMQSLHLIIGGTDDAHIRILSDFARAYNITHVVPFRQNVAEVQSNQQIFQLNQPPNILNIRASNEFLRLHSTSNIVFVTGGQNNQMNFVNQLQSDLRRNGISFEVLASNELNTELRSRLSTDRTNVIVPTSDEITLLRIVMNELDEVKEDNPALVTRLFGYSAWQAHTGLVRRFHRFGTHIFSNFFVNSNDLSTRAFNDNFRRWYGRSPMDSFPNWALRGYDTGLFFLTALHRHGSDFAQHLPHLRVPTLQYVFNFERASNWGGYINTGIIIVHYDTDGTIHRIDRSRQ